jgi:Tol biopolymer transport system component
LEGFFLLSQCREFEVGPKTLGEEESDMSKSMLVMSATLFLALGILLVALLSVRMPIVTGGVSSATPPALARLTSDSVTDLRPVWSPDNRWIAFESDRDGGTFHIYVMKTDGNALRALTSGATDDRRPIWTPDGKAILFDSNDGTRQEIWSVNVADGSQKQLTHTDGLASFASLSPDGQQIVFYLYKDGNLDLWTARADGSNARALTDRLVSVENSQCSFACHQAAWSPDSQRLAFTGGDGKSIWIMRADGSEMQSVIEDGETNHFPWFLADGRVAFITEYTPPNYGAAWTNAWAYDFQTGERTLLQEFMSMQGPIDWSADYRQVLFHSPRGDSFDVYLINLNAPGGLAALRGTPVPAQPLQAK